MKANPNQLDPLRIFDIKERYQSTSNALVTYDRLTLFVWLSKISIEFHYTQGKPGIVIVADLAIELLPTTS